MNEPSPPLRESVAEVIALLTEFSVRSTATTIAGGPSSFGTVSSYAPKTPTFSSPPTSFHNWRDIPFTMGHTFG